LQRELLALRRGRYGMRAIIASGCASSRRNHAVDVGADGFLRCDCALSRALS
jgi:hypothetical protein